MKPDVNTRRDTSVLSTETRCEQKSKSRAPYEIFHFRLADTRVATRSPLAVRTPGFDSRLRNSSRLHLAPRSAPSTPFHHPIWTPPVVATHSPPNGRQASDGAAGVRSHPSRRLWSTSGDHRPSRERAERPHMAPLSLAAVRRPPHRAPPRSRSSRSRAAASCACV